MFPGAIAKRAIEDIPGCIVEEEEESEEEEVARPCVQERRQLPQPEEPRGRRSQRAEVRSRSRAHGRRQLPEVEDVTTAAERMALDVRGRPIGLTVAPNALEAPMVNMRHTEYETLLDSVYRASRCARSAAQIAESAAIQFRAEASAFEAAHASLAARMHINR